jgi:hypothetical protein
MRIDTNEDGTVVQVDGQDATADLRLRSEDDVTFPAVWLDGERIYDVEVRRNGAVVATVPPRSPDVDASFEEHERRRA